MNDEYRKYNVRIVHVEGSKVEFHQYLYSNKGELTHSIRFVDFVGIVQYDTTYYSIYNTNERIDSIHISIRNWMNDTLYSENQKEYNFYNDHNQLTSQYSIKAFLKQKVENEYDSLNFLIKKSTYNYNIDNHYSIKSLVKYPTDSAHWIHSEHYNYILGGDTISSRKIHSKYQPYYLIEQDTAGKVIKTKHYQGYIGGRCTSYRPHYKIHQYKYKSNKLIKESITQYRDNKKTERNIIKFRYNSRGLLSNRIIRNNILLLSFIPVPSYRTNYKYTYTYRHVNPSF